MVTASALVVGVCAELCGEWVRSAVKEMKCEVLEGRYGDGSCILTSVELQVDSRGARSPMELLVEDSCSAEWAPATVQSLHGASSPGQL